MPKDFESHFNNKFKESNKKKLIQATGYFLTKWSDIDPYVYFKCGFELLKGFSYFHFFDKKVMLLYQQRDKNKKREVKVVKEKLVESAKFVKRYMNDNNLSFRDYIDYKEGNRSIAVKHYLHNNLYRKILSKK